MNERAEYFAILAAALAACKVKDEAIEAELLRADYGRIAMRKALAIQPDDSALKVWLEEPVAWMFSDSWGTHYTDDKREWYDAVGIESVTPLYAPKGMK